MQVTLKEFLSVYTLEKIKVTTKRLIIRSSV
jgi:hypothetical protein